MPISTPGARAAALACSVAITFALDAAFAADAVNAPATMPATVVPKVVDYQAQPLPLGAVRLTGGPLKRAQDLDAEYLLKLEPDRMVAALRKLAGLEPKAKQYGGWDAEGRQLTGHIAGHYLSAVSYMYHATGDVRFKERADYLVAELKEIQDKHGDGYIGGLMGHAAQPTTRPTSAPTTAPTTRRGRREEPPVVDGKILFKQLAEGQIRSSGFDLNGMWSPWYVQHKIYAGLRDAYRLTGNRTALEVEIKFSEWAQNTVGHFTDEQVQKMLATEFGAMNEVFIDLYADTGDKRWLTLADKFYHKAIAEPLASGQNILPGKHGNTQVPKLLGHLVRYVYTGDKADGDAARFFWDAVVDHHSFATGGHGYDEYFGPPDKLSGQVDGSGQRSRSLRTAETCNVYNMLKYTRQLFALKPEARYAEFHERALYNHILASIDPENGRTSYMVPVGPGVSQEYQDMFGGFTCCVGSGMESHALHADGLYFEAGDRLWVNIYAPSVATWKSAGATLTMETAFPEGEEATLKVSLEGPKELTLAFRRPAWVTDGFTIAVNGQPVADVGSPASYIEVRRTWTTGDLVTIRMPKTLRTEPLPDNPSRVALMWGPLVLAGDFGSPRGEGENDARRLRVRFPVLPYADRPLSQWLEPVAGELGSFRAKTADGTEVKLVPFYKLHNRRYSLYWDLFTPTQWAERQAAYAAQETRQQAMANATVGYFQPGEMQPERDFSFQADAGSEATRVDGQPARRGGAWMSIEVPTDPDEANAIIVTTRGERNPRTPITITLNDTPVGEPTSQPDEVSGLINLTFRVAPELTKDRKRATIRFQAEAGRQLPTILGVRVVRIEQLQEGTR